MSRVFVAGIGAYYLVKERALGFARRSVSVGLGVAAMLLPIGVGLLRDAGLQPKQSEFGRALMIATAFGALIGGIGTPAGTAANLVAIAQLKQLANVQISFARWTLYGAPAAAGQFQE